MLYLFFSFFLCWTSTAYGTRTSKFYQQKLCMEAHFYRADIRVSASELRLRIEHLHLILLLWHTLHTTPLSLRIWPLLLTCQGVFPGAIRAPYIDPYEIAHGNAITFFAGCPKTVHVCLPPPATPARSTIQIVRDAKLSYSGGNGELAGGVVTTATDARTRHWGQMESYPDGWKYEWWNFSPPKTMGEWGYTSWISHILLVAWPSAETEVWVNFSANRSFINTSVFACDDGEEMA